MCIVNFSFNVLNAKICYLDTIYSVYRLLSSKGTIFSSYFIIVSVIPDQARPSVALVTHLPLHHHHNHHHYHCHHHSRRKSFTVSPVTMIITFTITITTIIIVTITAIKSFIITHTASWSPYGVLLIAYVSYIFAVCTIKHCLCFYITTVT